jgi:cobalt-zinc-cadmium efflux system outer membrane protein
MRLRLTHVLVALPALASACVPRGQRIDYEEFVRAGDVPAPRHQDRQEEIRADEASLEKETHIEPIIRITLARNPDVREAEERVREALDRVPPSGRLPDLELTYQQWGVPLTRPYALNEADTLMLGVRQMFPAPGSLDAQERAAVEQAEIVLYTLRARQLDVTKQVQRAYYEYFLVDREYRIHREHVELTERIVELTRAGFRSGNARQQDILRVNVEVSALHRDLATIEQRRRSVIALLNSLMARAAGAPLGPVPELEAMQIAASQKELEQLALEKRPELLVAAHGVERSKANADTAERLATWPSFMVGVDYWFMPLMDEQHAYGAMVSINLPWLNPKRREEVRVAERATAADERALESARITVRYEVADAYARYEAARTAYLIIRNNLIPAAQQSFEAAQAGFATGSGDALALLDALQSLLQIRLDEVRTLIALKSAIVDLERAVGTDLDEAAIPQGAQS